MGQAGQLMKKRLVYLLGKRSRFVRTWYWNKTKRWLWGIYWWLRDRGTQFSGE